MTEITNEQIQALIARGEEDGCVNLSHFNELVAEHELTDDEVSRLYEQLEERHIELSDDCGRASEDESTYVNGDLATATTGAPTLPQRGGPLAAADEGGGGRARQADRAR